MIQVRRLDPPLTAGPPEASADLEHRVCPRCGRVSEGALRSRCCSACGHCWPVVPEPDAADVRRCGEEGER